MNSEHLHCTATKILNSEIAEDEQIIPLALEMRPQDTCGKILVALEMKPQDRISGDGWKSQSFPVWRTIQLSGTVQNCPGLGLYILGRLDVHCLGQRPLSQDQRSYFHLILFMDRENGNAVIYLPQGGLCTQSYNYIAGDYDGKSCWVWVDPLKSWNGGLWKSRPVFGNWCWTPEIAPIRFLLV